MLFFRRKKHFRVVSYGLADLLLCHFSKILYYSFPKEMQIFREFIIKLAIVIAQLHKQFAQDITSEIESLAFQFYERRSPEEI